MSEPIDGKTVALLLRRAPLFSGRWRNRLHSPELLRPDERLLLDAYVLEYEDRVRAFLVDVENCLLGRASPAGFMSKVY